MPRLKRGRRATRSPPEAEMTIFEDLDIFMNEPMDGTLTTLER
jgi:hypothetical protein